MSGAVVLRHIDRGNEDECKLIMKIVNDAYKLECDPQSPVSFKHDGIDRFTSYDNFRAVVDSSDYEILVGEAEGSICGSVFLNYEKDGSECIIGPLACAPHAQGRGVGSHILMSAEQRLKEKGMKQSTLYVVSCRTDLFPYYEKRGYKVVGSLPFPVEEECATPVELVKMTKAL